MLTLTRLATIASIAFVTNLSVANAATMTFDACEVSSVCVENGITATAGAPFEQITGRPHLDDEYQGSASSLTFTMRKQFDAVSFDLNPLGFSEFLPTDRYLNVLVQGRADGFLVAQTFFNMGAEPIVFEFGSAFTNLDSLFIGFAEIPDNFPDCNAQCSHYEVDNVTLAPVPIPASLPLLAIGLGLLGFLRRKLKRPALNLQHTQQL